MVLGRSSDPGLLLWSDLPSVEFAALASFAEAAGYSEVWYTDISFSRDCYIGLALAASQTDAILLGPGVSEPFARHPAQIATAMATLDEVSGGRIQLGLGSGTREVTRLGASFERPLRRLEEAVELARLVLAGDAVTYGGQEFTASDVSLSFQPTRDTIPIFIATHSPRTLRMSGRMADGVLLANLAHQHAIEAAIAEIHRGEQESGRPKGTVAVHLRLELCLSDSEESAFETVKARFAHRLLNTFPRWDYLEALGIEPTARARSAAEARDLAGIAQELTPEDLRATALFGSSNSVVEQLQRTLGHDINKLVIRPLTFPGLGLEDVIGEFRADVWPRVTQTSPDGLGAP